MRAENNEMAFFGLALENELIRSELRRVLNQQITNTYGKRNLQEQIWNQI